MNHDTKTSFIVFLFVLAALTLSQLSHAAINLQPTVSGYGSGMLSSPSGGHTMTPANDGYIKPSTVNVGGKPITVPATMRMAQNAGQYAKNAMKLNPWGIAGTLAAAWLAAEGMEWINNEWIKTQYLYESAPHGCPDYVSLDALLVCIQNRPGNAGYTWTLGTWPDGRTFRNGSHWSYYSRSGTPSTAPATQADWDDLPDPLPAVAPELPYAPYMPQGVPVEAPEYDFTPFQTPLGNPYTKPDGSTSQPMASVSPNGDSITVDTYDLPVTDPQGNPVPSPTPQDTPDPVPENKTQCEKFPNSLGCSELGTVSDLAVGTETRTIATIAPISVGGVGACPAPLTTSFMGQPISFSYDMPCSFATSLKPLILAIAWLSAGLIFIGGVRQ